MEIIPQPADYQKLTLQWRVGGLTHAVVPTMGALHAGHWRLVEVARERAARVSVTLFVNPKQFGMHEDLDKYPRTFESDAEGCYARGVDALFVPTKEAMYPSGFATRVMVDKLTE